MKFGLVGTGHWARVTQAAGLVAAPEAQLVGVWGRDPAKAQALAGDVGATAYDDVDEMFARVDAVAFSVPPDVQAEIAVRAARAGRHLLLEKPVATDAEAAARVADAVAAARVASVVFFTGRFEAGQRAWLEQVRRRSDWDAARGSWIGAAFAPGSPFDTSWRREKGGLWDVGPHALAMLTGALGPITRVVAEPGRRDLVHLVLQHEGGASSTATLTLTAPPEASQGDLTVWGPGGISELPTRGEPADVAIQTAIRELVEAAGSDAPSHPCDVHFGRRVVELLADAERQVAAARGALDAEADGRSVG